MNEFSREKTAVKDRKFVEALARGLDVLRAFSNKGGVLGNQEIAAYTGLPKPTVSRMTYTLTQLGYLTFSNQLEKYQLDAGVLALGYAYTSNLHVRQMAKPLIDEMAQRTKTSVGITCRDRLSMIYVENCRGDGAQSLRMDIGSRMPIATCASGRAYLAAIPVDERDLLLSHIEQKSGDNWPKYQAAIQKAVDEYDEKGYCLSLGDWEKNVNAVSVPIELRDGKIICVTCGGPSYRVTKEMVIDSLSHQLVHLAGDITQLGV